MNRSPLSPSRMLASALLALTFSSALAACDDDTGKIAAVSSPTPTLESFAATPERVNAGEPVTLSWKLRDVTEITLTSDDGATQVQLPGEEARAGSLELLPQQTTTYTLTARNNPGGAAPSSPVSATVQVVVDAVLPAPTVVLRVSPAQVRAGDPSALTWTVANAETLELEANGTPVELADPTQLSGSLQVSPTEDTTWTMKATGPGGTTSASASIEVLPVEVNPPPVIDTFTATPDQGLEGAPFTLAWTTTDATAVAIEGPDGLPVAIDANDVDGEINLSFEATGTFTLTATGAGGDQVTAEVSVTATVEVNTVRITSFALEDDVVVIGTPATLTFTAEHATGLRLLAGEEEVALPGDINLDGDDITVTLAGSTVFTLIAEGAQGPISATLDVAAVEPVTIDYFRVSPTSINAGEGVFLEWETTGATMVVVLDGDGNRTDPGAFDIDGNFGLGPYSDITYVLVARGPGGEARASIDVEVDATPRVALAASPETIIEGEAAELSWVTTSIFNLLLTTDQGESVNIINEPTRAGSVIVHPTQTTTYTIAGPGPGGDGSATVTVTVVPLERAPRIVSFTASATGAEVGGEVTVRWTTANASSLQLEAFHGDALAEVLDAPLDGAGEGEATFTLLAPTRLVLTAVGEGGTRVTSSLDLGVLGSVTELRLSEVFYAPGPGLEWVELYNASAYPVQLSGAVVGYGAGSFADNTLTLPTLLVEPGACVVLGGPYSDTDNGGPVFDATLDFDPDPSGVEIAAGFALFAGSAGDITPGAAPFDAVVYGGPLDLADSFIAPSGEAYLSPDVAAALAGGSLVRRFRRDAAEVASWETLAHPTPGRCFGLEDADFADGFDNQLFEGRRSGPEAGGNLIGLASFDASPQRRLRVFFGDVEAACELDSQGLRCVVPPGVGRVDLTLLTGDRALIYPSFYSYERIDYCNLQFPEELTVAPGAALPPIYGRVYQEGVTEALGDSGELLVQWGYGPALTDPAISPDWTWLPTFFNVQIGNDDEFAIDGVLAPAAEGAYSYAFRARPQGTTIWTWCDRDGTVNNNPSLGNLFSVEQQGALQVIAP